MQQIKAWDLTDIGHMWVNQNTSGASDRLTTIPQTKPSWSELKWLTGKHKERFIPTEMTSLKSKTISRISAPITLLGKSHILECDVCWALTQQDDLNGEADGTHMQDGSFDFQSLWLGF